MRPTAEGNTGAQGVRAVKSRASEELKNDIFHNSKRRGDHGGK